MVTAIMSETKSVSTITRQKLDALVAKAVEPQWLSQDRLQAWEGYEQTPMPGSKDEDWRRTDISAVNIETLPTLDLQPTSQDGPNFVGALAFAQEFIKDNSGILSQSVSDAGYLKLSADLQQKGVIFCSLPSAVEKHAELVRPYLTEVVTSDTNDKFRLLNRALFNSGMFLYVPANLEVKLPFVSGIELGSQTGALFPRLLVVMGANSKAQLIQVISAESTDKTQQPVSLLAANTEIHLDAGAQFTYLELESLHSNIACINKVRNVVKRDAVFKSLSVATGSHVTKSEIVTCLQEPGATSKVLGVVLGNNSEHYNFNTIQEHNAPDTTSDINFRVALNDSASSLYQGIIKVDKIAQRIAAFQSNKNLLLGEAARADSIPKLEILADDVKCSHGATVGPVDSEQVFYLNSRGLSSNEAQELIVLGFFRQVLEQLSIPEAAEWLQAVLSPKLSAQHQAG